MSALLRAYVALVALSAATTLVAVVGVGKPVAGVLILTAAWAKARLILLWYLDLAPVRGWRQGILFGLGAFCVVLLGLYLIASR